MAMANGVFIHRADSIYDDSPAERYQFPKMYLERVRACLGDWIVYYEPRKVESSRGYFGIAKIKSITPDEFQKDMYVAHIEPGIYLDFINTVPLSGPNGVPEQGILSERGAYSARIQWAVRPLSKDDFARIIDLGLGDKDRSLPRIDVPTQLGSFEEEQTPFQFDHIGERLIRVSQRPERDRIFRHVVLRAYNERCAVTGLKLINGGGRAEVEAAHIKPVDQFGPDIACNGIALSGTAHWMFDRGLISLDDEYRIIISRKVNDIDSIQKMLNKNGCAFVPERISERPHPRFLDWHRTKRFEQ